MDATHERHPWNTGFEWGSPVGPFQALSPTQTAQFDEAGFVVVDRLLGAEQLASLRAELDVAEARADAFLQTQRNRRVHIAEAGAITFSTHLVLRSEAARRTVTDPAVLGLCADLVGPDVNLYWDQLVYKKPEKPRRFPWHQDNGYTYLEPQQYLTIWLALTDATVDNGCPWVAPGLHRLGTLAHHYIEPLGWECFDAPELRESAEVRAGGAVVFSSLTPHLTGPNTTGEVRKAYIIQYAPHGARICRGDPAAGPPTDHEPADDAGRQFPVLRAGRPVPA
jgi:ectoine hydroxylase-related dioxygenase (phytanoyl-CoA dioxygenase family)